MKAFGTTIRGEDMWLEPRQVEEVLRNPNSYLYVVENVRHGRSQHFSLKVLGGERLAGMLERRKEKRYFMVPWPAAAYDSCPTTVD